MSVFLPPGVLDIRVTGCEACAVLASHGLLVRFSPVVNSELWCLRHTSDTPYLMARTRPFSPRSDFVLGPAAAALMLPHLPPDVDVSAHDPAPYQEGGLDGGLSWCLRANQHPRPWPVTRSPGGLFHAADRLTALVGLPEPHDPWKSRYCFSCGSESWRNYPEYVKHIRWHIDATLAYSR